MHVLLLIGTSLSPLRYPPELDTYLKGFHGDNCATVGVGTIDADGQRLMDATEVRHKTQVLRTMSARAVLPPFRSESSHARLAFWRRHVAYFVKRGVFKSLLLVLGQQGGGGRRRAPGETNGRGVVEGGWGVVEGEASAAAKPNKHSSCWRIRRNGSLFLLFGTIGKYSFV